MPEGDTVRRSAGRLHQALAGRQLTRAELRWPNLGDVDLNGLWVVAVTAYGKHILTRLAGEAAGAVEPLTRMTQASGEAAAAVGPLSRLSREGGETAGGGIEPLTLHSHLRMDGSWHVAPTTSGSWPSTTRVGVRAALQNAEWTATGVWLGMLDLVPTANEDTLIGHLGPDILSDDFADPAVDWGVTEALRRLAAKPDEAVGAALLDQRNLAGIGTFYMAETLFSKGISPWTPIREVTDLRGVVERARRMLQTNLARATPTTTGDTRPGNRQWVHGRSGQPCRRCGATVRVAPIEVYHRSPGQTAGLERTAFYCPGCQPGRTPTDDGRPQRPIGTGRQTTSRPAEYRRL